LILGHAHLVHSVAWGLRQRLPWTLDIDDLAQTGFLGLIRAADSWRPNGGAPFSTWARYNIRGAIIDAFRRKAYKWETCKVPHPEWKKVGQPVPRHGSRWVADAFHDRRIDPEPLPDRVIEKTESQSILRRAVRYLPHRQRRVVNYLLRGRSLLEIGQRMGISESLACQEKLRALPVLRRILEAKGVRP